MAETKNESSRFSRTAVARANLTLSFAAAVGTVIVLMQRPRNATCFGGSDIRWNLSVAFGIATQALFAINLKRWDLAVKGGYTDKILGILEHIRNTNYGRDLDELKREMARKKEAPGDDLRGRIDSAVKHVSPGIYARFQVYMRDRKLRFIGILLHVVALVTSIWLLANLGKLNFSCENPHQTDRANHTLEASAWVAIGAFYLHFLLEAVAAFGMRRNDSPNEESIPGKLNDLKQEHSFAHFIISVLLCGICVVVFMRCHEELNVEGVDQSLLALSLFSALLTTIMISSDWFIRTDLIHTSLFRTHRMTYVGLFFLTIFSTGTWVEKQRVDDDVYISNTRRDLIDWQFCLAIATLTAAPLLARLMEMIDGEDNKLTSGLRAPRTASYPNTLRDERANGGMRGSSLTRARAREMRVEELQFV